MGTLETVKQLYVLVVAGYLVNYTSEYVDHDVWKFILYKHLPNTAILRHTKPSDLLHAL